MVRMENVIEILLAWLVESIYIIELTFNLIPRCMLEIIVGQTWGLGSHLSMFLCLLSWYTFFEIVCNEVLVNIHHLQIADLQHNSL